MKITAIKQQIKRQDRYSIYIDEKYSFSLSEGDLIAMGLHKDQEIEPAELERLKQNSQIGKAYDKTVRLISMRSRSHWEIEDYLKRKGYDEEVIEQVKIKLEKLGLVDDAAFAKAWVASRMAVKPRSKRQLYAELSKKHINRELIEEVLTDFGAEQELEQLRGIIERKRRSHQYQDPQKLMAYLARQGYSYDLIKQTLDEVN